MLGPATIRERSGTGPRAGAARGHLRRGAAGCGNIARIARLDGIATYFGYNRTDRLASEVWKDAAGNV